MRRSATACLTAVGIVAAVLAACQGGSAPGANRPGTFSGSTSGNASPSSTGPSTSQSSSGSTPTRTPGPSASRTTTRPPSQTPTRTTTATPTALPAALLGRVVVRVPTSAHVVALTFDAGANADGVTSILGTLRAHRVAASFFLTGSFVAHYSALSRDMAAAGRVGDHTVTHPHLPGLADVAVRAEVLDARSDILAATGHDPRPFFRFPYGDTSAHTLAVVNGLGFAAVGWTVDTLGWEGTSSGVTVGEVVSRVLAACSPGEIVLMHVGSNPSDHSTLDADALPQVIAGLAVRGYSFVTLDALLG